MTSPTQLDALTMKTLDQALVREVLDEAVDNWKVSLAEDELRSFFTRVARMTVRVTSSLETSAKIPRTREERCDHADRARKILDDALFKDSIELAISGYKASTKGGLFPYSTWKVVRYTATVALALMDGFDPELLRAS